MGVLYQEQIADFSAQGLENSRVFFFNPCDREADIFFVCLSGETASTSIVTLCDCF